jgi:tellurite resistance protein TerC
MGTPLLWIGFNLFVLLMLAVDLGVFHRRAHVISLGEAGAWSVVWVVVSLTFNLGLLHWYGKTPALEFFTGYLIEKSLSVDNIFVFVLLFKYFGVEHRYQHRVLFWGILGALIMRGAMIGLGVALIQRFEWVLYLFGAFLIYAGARMMLHKAEEVHPERNPVFRWAQKFLPLTKTYDGQKLFVRAADPRSRRSTWQATPLFLVLLVVETTDLAFALDSIPEIFGITRDPFIVYTSNVFAILGLRAFYFLLAGVLPYFRYLSLGLSAVLMLIGVKMLVDHWVHVPTHISLAVVGAILSVAVIASVIAARREAQATRQAKKNSAAAAEPLATAVAPLEGTIRLLTEEDPARRVTGASRLYWSGCALALPVLNRWCTDREFAALLVPEKHPSGHRPGGLFKPKPTEITVGVAVSPENFEKIRAANGAPRLAEIPPDQDAKEFELHFDRVRLDVLTTKSPGGGGVIARFLQKFGEGVQQVEFLTTDVDRATHILRSRFGIGPIYPQTRRGADGTRVNFFLVTSSEKKKVLIELVEAPRPRKT